MIIERKYDRIMSNNGWYIPDGKGKLTSLQKQPDHENDTGRILMRFEKRRNRISSPAEHDVLHEILERHLPWEENENTFVSKNGV